MIRKQRASHSDKHLTELVGEITKSQPIQKYSGHEKYTKTAKTFIGIANQAEESENIDNRPGIRQTLFYLSCVFFILQKPIKWIDSDIAWIDSLNLQMQWKYPASRLSWKTNSEFE